MKLVALRSRKFYNTFITDDWRRILEFLTSPLAYIVKKQGRETHLWIYPILRERMLRQYNKISISHTGTMITREENYFIITFIRRLSPPADARQECERKSFVMRKRVTQTQRRSFGVLYWKTYFELVFRKNLAGLLWRSGNWLAASGTNGVITRSRNTQYKIVARNRSKHLP